MSVVTPPQRQPEAFQVHRQLKGPKATKRDLPSRDITDTSRFMNPPVAPIPGANTGKSNKFTSKSPLVTTMNSAIK